MQAVADLSRQQWAATGHQDHKTGDGCLDFTGKSPLVMTTLERLQQHGPLGLTWRRVAQHRLLAWLPMLALTGETRRREPRKLRLRLFSAAA